MNFVLIHLTKQINSFFQGGGEERTSRIDEEKLFSFEQTLFR